MTRKKVALLSNLCIAAVLVSLCVAVFTTDLNNVFISVAAPISSGSRSGGKVSLMFVVEDEGSDFLVETLTLLRQRNVPATFFVGGAWASRNPDKLMQIAEYFELGNHAYNNRALSRLSRQDQHTEIAKCNEKIYEITKHMPGCDDGCGVKMRVFLPPRGSFNRDTLRSVDRLGLRTVMWSKNAMAGSILTNATREIKSGDLVALRPSLATFSVLNNIINEYARQNLQIVSVGSHLKIV